MTKFQKLTRKEKVEHIWEYYRYHIIGGILGTIMVFNLLFTIFGPKPPPPAANVVIMGMYKHDEDKITQFKEEIGNIIDNGEENDENGKVEVQMSQVDWESASPMDAAMNQKLTLMFTANEVDILIVQQPKFDSFINNIQENIYEPLDDKPELMEILEANKDNLIKRKLEGDAEERVYGLSVKDNIKLQDIGLGDDYIVSIPNISANKEDALKTIKWLYE